MRALASIAALLLVAGGPATALERDRAVIAEEDAPSLWSRLSPALSLEAEFRYFPQPANDDAQHDSTASMAATPSFEADWDDRDQGFTLTLFGRADRHDAHRTRADVREALYRYTGRDFEWRIGIGKEFWGVTESASLVDVINQTDFVEDIDGEAKLGQPMINLAWFSGVGTFDLFLLPDFRERTFPAEDGRPRPLLPVATERALFPDGEGLDVALRYFNSFGAWDIGVSAFHGTSRDPRFDFDFDACDVTATFQPLAGAIPVPTVRASCAQAQSTTPPPLLTVDNVRVDVDDPVFVPVYERINQVGVDIQHVRGALALKLEAVRRWSNAENYSAAAAGLEYTLYGLLGSDYSLGLLSEYLYDSRGRLDHDIARAGAALAQSETIRFDSLDAARDFQAGLRTQSAATFQNDLFTGLRLAFNDLAGTEIRAGAIRDLDTGATTASLEGGRRLGGSTRVAINLRLFSDIPVTDPQYGFRDDDYLEFTLTRFF